MRLDQEGCSRGGRDLQAQRLEGGGQEVPEAQLRAGQRQVRRAAGKPPPERRQRGGTAAPCWPTACLQHDAPLRM